MKITVVHNRVSDNDAADARDVLQQVESVTEALALLGHEVSRTSCTLNLEAMRDRLGRERPDLVFNLVEDLDGHGRLIHLFPFLLEALGLAYTGSPAAAVLLTSNKIMAKERMLMAGLPTPAWLGPCPPEVKLQAAGDGTGNKWIIKSLWEHASIGLDSDSVLNTESLAVLAGEIRKRRAQLGGACFAEKFIDGREFNLSLLAGPDGPEVLPPAEIIFEGFDPGMVRIVDYQAKWEEDSYTYHHTPRRFDFPAEDAGLLRRLRDIARRCWKVFSLAGYARVDFRVNETGQPHILEINANPCLSPDAGFFAAVARAGMNFSQAVARIVADAGKDQLQEN